MLSFMNGIGKVPSRADIFAPITQALTAPPNLFTADQSSFVDASHIDFRSNWEISDGRLSPLGVNANDARLNLDNNIVAGNAHCIVFEDYDGGNGNVKANLAGNGSVSGVGYSNSTDNQWTKVQYFTSAEVANAYTRIALKPTSTYDSSIDNIQVYDLSTTDPNTVTSDVVLCLGDSNISNATSEFVTEANNETDFDPRIWYIPHLRADGNNGNTGSTRHKPQPCMEPVSSVNAKKMSPVHAIGSRLVDYAANRGNPLLMAALGEPGTGLRGTADWDKDSTQANTGARSWDEFPLMMSAIDSLSPSYNVIGAVVSLGANDFTAGSYNNWVTAALAFVANVRSEIGNANLPIVWVNIGQHVADSNVGFANLQAEINKFDKDSGDLNAISNLTVVNPVDGNQLDPLDDSDPHFNAAGVQRNGRDAGDALLALL